MDGVFPGRCGACEWSATLLRTLRGWACVRGSETPGVTRGPRPAGTALGAVGSAQAEVVLQAEREAGLGGDGAHGGEDPGHERGPVEGVVPEGERLPPVPNSTSWWATSPRIRTECTGMPSNPGRRARLRGRAGSRPGTAAHAGPSRVPRRPAGRCAGQCRTARRPCRVVQFDDLDGVVEAGGLRREPHHQHGADARSSGTTMTPSSGCDASPARTASRAISAGPSAGPRRRSGCPASTQNRYVLRRPRPGA